MGLELVGSGSLNHVIGVSGGLSVAGDCLVRAISSVRRPVLLALGTSSALDNSSQRQRAILNFIKVVYGYECG